MKFYSEVTNKVYDTEAELNAAELNAVKMKTNAAKARLRKTEEQKKEDTKKAEKAKDLEILTEKLENVKKVREAEKKNIMAALDDLENAFMAYMEKYEDDLSAIFSIDKLLGKYLPPNFSFLKGIF